MLNAFTCPTILLQTQLEIEPRFPLFGGWQTTFTIGYGLPLQDFVFSSDGKRFLNITFGSPMEEILIEKLIVKVGGQFHQTSIIRNMGFHFAPFL